MGSCLPWMWPHDQPLFFQCSCWPCDLSSAVMAVLFNVMLCKYGISHNDSIYLARCLLHRRWVGCIYLSCLVSAQMAQSYSMLHFPHQTSVMVINVNSCLHTGTFSVLLSSWPFHLAWHSHRCVQQMFDTTVMRYCLDVDLRC